MGINKPIRGVFYVVLNLVGVNYFGRGSFVVPTARQSSFIRRLRMGMKNNDFVCTYCGDNTEIQREHVIPATYYMLRSFDPNDQWIVSACRICNNLAGSSLFFSIPEKAKYILRRYRLRYKKVLSMPFWTQDELNEVGYSLRHGIEQSMLMRMIVLRRIRHIEAVSEYDKGYLRPKWVEVEYMKYRKEMGTKKKRKRVKKPTST